MNENEWDTWYIYYRYEKKFDNGNVDHHLKFKTNNKNKVVNNLLMQLNTEDVKYKYVQSSDLNINEKYKIVTFKNITTKYSDQVSVSLDNKYKLILNHRFVTTTI